MTRILIRFGGFCCRLSASQPKPYIAHCKETPLSWWLYKYVPGTELELCQRNWFGNLWYNFWMMIGQLAYDLAE